MQLAVRAGPGDEPRHTRFDDGGFIMVVLLISMAVAAVWMAAALPSWRQRAQRERELELAFRGEQYARALALYYCKTQTFPPTIDMLVSQRYLRKKYRDPITGAEFAPLGGLMTNVARGSTPAPTAGTSTTGRGVPNNTGASAQPGITGVRSTSQATSIRVYNQQQVYSQWPFDAAAMMARVCAPAGRGAPGGAPGRGGDTPGRGGPGTAPGRGGPAAPGRGGPVGPGVNPGGRGPAGTAPPPPRGGGGPAGPGGAGS